jgi:hypothetical protein
MCLDGNFSLVRKKSSGKSLDLSAASTRLFIEDAQVHDYLKTTDDVQSDQYKGVQLHNAL